MRAAIFHRRRAERFAQLLDEADGGRRRRRARSELDEEFAQLVAVSQRVRQMTPRVAAGTGFRAELRTMLVAAAERESADATVVLPEVRPRPARLGGRAWPRPRREAAGTAARRARARGAVIVGVAAGTLALSGMSAASGDAVPGDVLYGIKRSTERAQLALVNTEISRGQLYLEFARTRMTEASAVNRDEANLVTVLADMDTNTRQGVRLLTSAAVARRDPMALDIVDGFVETHRRDVAGLLDQTASRARLRESLTLLDSVSERVASLRASLACGADGSDALGPVPDSCTTAMRPVAALRPGTGEIGPPAAHQRGIPAVVDQRFAERRAKPPAARQNGTLTVPVAGLRR